MRRFIALASFLFFLAACETTGVGQTTAANAPTRSVATNEPERCRPTDMVRFLLGDWIADSGEKVTRESWKAVSDRTFEGNSVVQSSETGKITWRESMRLAEMGDGIFYVVKPEQNEMPVAFRLTACDAGRVVFENNAHDFPKRIEYFVPADGRLTVRVSDGQDQGFELRFTRQDR